LDLIEDRNPAFWRWVADHPDVQASGVMGGPGLIESLVVREDITPLRGEHGGYLFVRLDHAHELHALFRPEGWGWETNQLLKQALDLIFDRGALCVIVSEVGGNWRSRPPRSFGFRPTGEFSVTQGFALRPWTLTRAAWERSPARRRME
jgi:hypothetical protein